MTSYETLWTCDKCRSKSFNSFEEAVEHENNCKGEANHESDDEVQIISPPSQSAGGGSPSKTAPSTNVEAAKLDATEEVWTCDFCIESFPSYDEAVAHETRCKEKPEYKSKDKADFAQNKICTGDGKSQKKMSKAAQASSQTTIDLEMETSFVCDVCKTTEFSTYEEAAEHEAKCSLITKKGGVAKNQSSTATSPAHVGKRPEGGVLKKAPKRQRQERRGKADAVRTVWSCDVCHTAEFATFEEAAKHEKKCGGSGNTGREAGSGSSRLGRGFGTTSRKSRKSFQKRKSLEIDKPDPVRLVPLISDITSNENLRLSPFNMLAMAQIDLVLKQGLEGTGVKYEPRCRHCGATSKVNTLETLYKGIYSMTYSHLLKSCPHIPGSVRESLQKRQQNKKASSVSNDGRSLGLRQFCIVLIEKLGLVQSKSVSSGSEERKVIGRKGEEKKSHTKRTSELGPSIVIAKKSKPPNSGSKATGIQAAHVFTFEDEDGVKTILPPFDGVPLSSSFVSKLSTYTKLSTYEQFIVSQLELVEDRGCNKSYRPLLIRCQNCKFHPTLSVSKPLRSVEGWHKAVEDMGEHVVSCTFLSRPFRESIIQARTTGKGSGSLESFCSYLAGFLAIQESPAPGSDSGVVWGECPPMKPGYLSPTVYPEKLKSKLAPQKQHNAPPGSTKLVVDTSAPLTISDYAYLLTAQLQLVPVDRKVPVSSLGSYDSSLTLRQRSRRRNTSPLPSGRNTPTDLREDTPLSCNAIGLRCKHCCLTRPVTNVTELARSVPHQFYNHFKKCHLFPAAVMEKLDEVKLLQGVQKSQFVTSLPDYCRQVIGLYGLVDLEWNGVSCVAFRGDEPEIKKMLRGDEMVQLMKSRGANEKQGQEPFVLPLLVRKYANPVTLDVVKIAEGNRGRESSSDFLDVQVPLDRISENEMKIEASKEDMTVQDFTSSPKSSDQPVYNQVIDTLWKSVRAE